METEITAIGPDNKPRKTTVNLQARDYVVLKNYTKAMVNSLVRRAFEAVSSPLSDWRGTRHLDLKALGLTTWTDEEYMRWLSDRQAARDVGNDICRRIDAVIVEDRADAEIDSDLAALIAEARELEAVRW